MSNIGSGAKRLRAGIHSEHMSCTLPTATLPQFCQRHLFSSNLTVIQFINIIFHMSLHSSFEKVKDLAEGSLYSSSEFPEVVVRSSQDDFTDFDGEVDIDSILPTRNAVRALERYGIESVAPEFYLAEEGLMMVCKKLKGSTVEEEIKDGNQAAKTAYTETLLSLSSFLLEVVNNPNSMIMNDIVGPHQYTWESGRVVLHDISTVFHYSHLEEGILQAMTVDEAITMLSDIALDICEFDLYTDEKLVDTISSNLIEACDARLDRYGRQDDEVSGFDETNIRLFAECRRNPRALKLLHQASRYRRY